MIRLLFVTALAIAASPSAQCVTAGASLDYRSAPKFALVVGNDSYGKGFDLRNARRDAALMAARLRTAGYTTRHVSNADLVTLFREIGSFADALRHGGVGAFYYAGHGVQVKQRNYLVPTDARPGQGATLAQAALPVDYLIGRLRNSGAHLSIVLLDACRNEPGQFAPLYRGSASEAGFVPERPAKGMVIAYATQPGERALDGTGQHGPFAVALAKWIVQPGLPIEQALKHVMSDVRASTRDEQVPWMESSLVGNFAMVPAPGSRPMLVKAGTGSNGSAQAGTGRSAQVPYTGGGNDRQAPSLPAGIIEWFVNQDQDQQMQLTADVLQMAKESTPADLPRLVRQARRGSVMAQAALGTAYREGLGVAARSGRNNVAALDWLSRAARQQMPYAMNELGEMHYLGQGTERDPTRARKYFEAAAAQGYKPSKLNLLQLDMQGGQAGAEALRDMFTGAKPR